MRVLLGPPLVTVLHADVETFSKEDLKAAGAHRYAEHPSTELNCFGYAFDDEPVTCWVPAESVPVALAVEFALLCPDDFLLVQPHVPERVRKHIESGGEFRAHNAQFERKVLNGTAGRKVGFPHITIKQTVCTAAKMANHGLPRKLEDAALALGAHPKDKAGHANMMALAKPRRGKIVRWTPIGAPARFAKLYAYNVDDVKAERSIDNLVPDQTARELATYHLDQVINDRGVRADMEAVDNAQWLVRAYRGQLELLCLNKIQLKPTQREKISDWIKENGYAHLEDMQAETVKRLIAGNECQDNVKEILQIYSTYGMKAVSKFDAIENALCSDGRLHGMFLYYGASTGRWSSIIVQLQNLMRPVIKDVNTAIDAFQKLDIDWVKYLWSGGDDLEKPEKAVDPMKVIASTIRSMLIPAEGHDLLFLDFAGIESRVNAWLWNEEWKLKAFRDYDTIVGYDKKGKPIRLGPDLYKLAYARAFGILIEQVTDAQRQIGKVMELALGYEGGVGAFVTMVETYGIDLDELARMVLPILPQEVKDKANWLWEKQGSGMGVSYDVFIACDGLKQLWRAQHPRIKAGWKQLKEAAVKATMHKGKVFTAGRLLFKFEDRWLYMKLPSGRKIAYFKPSVAWPQKRVKREVDGVLKFTYVDDKFDDEGKLDLRKATLHYWGVDTKTRRYMKTSTYGGKTDENADQGISRDLLVDAMFRLEAANYPIVGTVHDEGIMEIPERFGSIEEASQLMCANEDWAADIPVAVEGHRGKRYKK